ncbi:MAG: HAMP domain-containing histidine kinase [Deltaproteobacteria bacterium]|nr:HAMP domain-containing histidine kinase [Deltaproteobacteria bacterium]
MENVPIKEDYIKTGRISPHLVQRVYKLHVQGALVQTGAVVAIWSALLLPRAFSIIDASAFFGITITGIAIILIHIPFLWGLKRISNRQVFEIYNLSINVFSALADTAIIYFLGGVRGMYLIFIYACLVAYVGISAPRRYPFIISGFCAIFFAAMAIMEHVGIIPHQNALWAYNFSMGEVILIIISFTASLFVLAFIASYASDVIKRTRTELARRNIQLEESKEAINRAVDALRDRNTILQESLDQLANAQKQLVESEKFAALGGLVAGVAHEINTPVGVGVTAASFLEDRTRDILKQMDSEQLSQDDVRAFLNIVAEASDTILKNLGRAADLVRNFKQVAVDQSSEVKRRFNLKEYIEGVLLSLRYQYKRTGHAIIVNCPGYLELVGFPGLFSQVITNLLMNSLIHGLNDVKGGEIVFDAKMTDEKLVITYSDNGKGMEGAAADKIFEPFFTTKRAEGGSGLGMSIVYNIITRTMGGRIECRTAPGEGVAFTITLPFNAGVLERA